MNSPEPPESPEPLAIIGMACRFAGGVDSPEAFWDLLREGRDTAGEVPPDRWEWYASQGHEYAAAVRDVTRRGSFLDDVRGFDAEFFDITPREAALMDPQQRIVLELAWEALEHAGIPPRDLAGTDAGVFMGVGADDYGRRLLEDLPRVEAWTGIGGAYCGVANRVSYTLDLRGPSMAVDTACSSSLVAVHLAAQALRAGECPVALAGGVMVMAAPGLSLVLDAAGATAPDGRSKSFDASADGYGRGEGGGVVVLKRLADARRDGDRVLAVIRGSAVHQDGRTNGIMAPSGRAQAHLMRRAYEAAGVDPATVDYVEAHGTGTRVGDPLEAGALAEVVGRDRPRERPCLIGSVKPNVGHLEAGAGVAGVIKTALALRHGEIPPSLNVTTPNPAVPWETSGLRVVTEPTPWPDTAGPRRAGVSGYGYGGTLAHVVLEEGDAPRRETGRDAGPALYPLSGASRAAVAEYAGRLADLLSREDGPNTTDAKAGTTDAEASTTDAEASTTGAKPGTTGVRPGTADVGHTLARRRTHLPYRAAVVAADRGQLVARLRELAGQGTGPATGTVLPGAGRGLVWVFSGHGSQWTGMGRELLAGDPVFAGVIDRLEPIFAEEMGLSPRAVIADDAPQPVHVVQPMIFAMQVALGAVWRARGVRPDAVIGHSVGEIAAAVTAGVLTLERGARLVCRRSLLLRRVAGRGAMALVNLPPEKAEARIGDRRDLAVAVAASTGSAVVSGDIGTVEELAGRWGAEGLVVRRVDSDVAFHSPHMDPLLTPLAEAAADLPPGPPSVRLYSTALEDPRSAAPRDGAYWAANLRGQVRFARAVTAAVEDGYRLFVEVSPHPVVEHSIGETLDELGVDDAYVTHSLRRGRPEPETLLTNLGLLYCHGADVDWSRAWPDGALTDLPGPAWQRRPHWAEEPAGRAETLGRHDPSSHTLLGGRNRLNGTTPAWAWLTRLDRESRPYPGRHPVRGVEIVPAAVLLNTFLAAASSAGSRADLADVALRVPVSLTDPRDLQVVLQDGVVRLSSRIVDGADDDAGWVTHTTAVVEPRSALPAGPVLDVTADEELPPGHVIDRLASLEVAEMGFPWAVEGLRRGDDGLVFTVRTDTDTDTGTGSGTPPATWAPLLDAVLSAASVTFSGPPVLRMPARIRRVTLADRPPARARVVVRVTGDDTVDVEITDLGGTVTGRLTGLRYGLPDGDARTVTGPRRLVHELVWRPVERIGPAATGDTATTGAAGELAEVILVGPDGALRDRLAARLGGSGVPYRVAAAPEELRESELTGPRAVVVVPPDAAPRGAGEVGDAAARAAWLLARTARRLAGTGSARPARLWCVTEGVREGRDPGALAQSALWGLGRVVGGEHPDLWGGVVDLGRSPRDTDALAEVLRGVRGEDVVAVRDSGLWVPRLRLPDGEPGVPGGPGGPGERGERGGPGAPGGLGGPGGTTAACRPDGTYLVTGGLGALGLEVARWLSDRGARRIVLAGRTALPPRDRWDDPADPGLRARIAAVRALERRGVTVVTVALDVSDARAAAEALSPAALGLPPIRGVVHAAGVVDDRVVRALDEASIRAVLRPKVDGALVLDALFPPGSVDFFVLFSSCGQLLGLPGQGAYAAGNAFLDALAARRRAAGDAATTSFGWTSWRGLGMSTSSEVTDAELAACGTGDITAAEAFDAWELAERYGLGYAAVLRTVPVDGGGRRPPVLAELSPETPGEEPEADAEAPRWAGLKGTELHEVLVEEIRLQVAAETKLAAAELDPRRPLVEMGLESVMTARIRRGLERRFRIPLPATLFWDRPTIDAIASLLAERVDGSAPISERSTR
ncbi:beta-ketoacyl synthase N-terminal-like domain-containing protein [Streptosporangium longisporum]|uniref:Phthiocerol type I polyketide synthase PpsA n=1 Tax=Streptosporangium longisporum TaxID=46187 RepID=A0ABP6LBC1_9ACTN